MFYFFHWKNLKIIYFCFFAYFFLFFNSILCEEESIRSRLNKIPLAEKKELENFFKYLFTREHIGYVIFDSKPIVIADFFAKHLSINVHSGKTSHIFRYNCVWNNYKSWEKYQNLFPMKNYLLRIFKDPADSSTYLITFINLKLCLKTIEENIDLFRKILGNSFTPKSLLEKIKSSEDILKEVLNDNHYLQGILLGYGNHNSLIFQKRSDFKNNLNKYKPPYCWNILQKEQRFSLTKMNPYEPSVLSVDLPSYLEDLRDSESLQLHNNYIEVWKELCEIYSHDTFLEVTLEALAK
jgi:hypothetical protein